MIIRTFKIVVALLALSLSASSQVVTRSQFAPYGLRKEADALKHDQNSSYIEFAPKAISSESGLLTRQQVISVPQSWVDAVAFLHLESVGSAYTVSINGVPAISCEDSLTPSDYNITPYLMVGDNTISITSRGSNLDYLERGVDKPTRPLLEGSYIYTQNRLRILDYQLEMTEHTDGEHGQLFIDVIVENGFNFPETIDIGFDIYDPAGKLLDFSTAQATIDGNATDTIRFMPHLYGAKKYRWDPANAMAMRMIGRASSRTTDQNLYSVMLFHRRNRVAYDHIPFKVGFTLPEYSEGVLSTWDNPATLKVAHYSALGDIKQAEADLRALKKSGYNTVKPDYPQPLWYYSLCDKVGLYVIDQAAINAPTAADDRAVGGTASNNPALVNEYVERVKKMYYRTRNFSCVVAYSLGGNSGNGYNMYKAYQWLKGVEKRRPIIYQGANGEWNSDTLTISE